MVTGPTPAEIRTLFANTDTDEVWRKAREIVRRIDPAFDFAHARSAFDDVVRLFRGDYPAYHSITTLYHDLHHTLDVFLCAVRLLHGVHLSGTSLSGEEVSQIMIAAMMHDVGYAMEIGDDAGTGAKYTQIHVTRGIEFMKRYLDEMGFPATWKAPLEPMIRCTDPAVKPSQIDFPDERTRLLGLIVGTADLVGQMADRTYLEKLLFLYFEFKEAHLGGYRNMHDLLRRTKHFYEITRVKLDSEFDAIYSKLSEHFQDWFGVPNNYYLESIEKNVVYLEQVIHLDEEQFLSMLKRGSIVAKAKSLADPDDVG
ncbi:MAG: HD domain-containing protein [Sulfuricella sp.]|nr:HD domain-containing protein [Sulfuricella sp.]